MKLFLFFILSVIICSLFRIGIKWFFFNKRKSLELDQLYQIFNENKNLDEKLFNLSILKISHFYKINYKKLRPNDQFSGNLGRVDSWILGGGQEDLEEYLQSVGLQKNDLNHIITIQDLVCILCKQRPGSL